MDQLIFSLSQIVTDEEKRVSTQTERIVDSLPSDVLQLLTRNDYELFVTMLEMQEKHELYEETLTRLHTALSDLDVLRRENRVLRAANSQLMKQLFDQREKENDVRGERSAGQCTNGKGKMVTIVDSFDLIPPSGWHYGGGSASMNRVSKYISKLGSVRVVEAGELTRSLSIRPREFHYSYA